MRISKFKTEKEEAKIYSPHEKVKDRSRDSDLKSPESDEIEENIITTNNTSNKKNKFVQEEIEYPSDQFLNLIESPDIKPKWTSKVAHVESKDYKDGDIRSSLPSSMRETSYFDGKDQIRSLLEQNKAIHTDDETPSKDKKKGDPSFNEGDDLIYNHFPWNINIYFIVG